MKRAADGLSRNASGWATNVALGFLLGFAPAVGRFFGIPFDVRHVTLSTGQLALAASSLGERWFDEGAFLRGLAGIGVMFVLNLSVAFSLSLHERGAGLRDGDGRAGRSTQARASAGAAPPHRLRETAPSVRRRSLLKPLPAS